VHATFGMVTVAVTPPVLVRVTTPSVMCTVMPSPKSVATTCPSDRSVEKAAPLCTWASKTSLRASPVGAAVSAANASLVGAKTVNGPVPARTVVRSPGDACSSVTNDDKSEVAIAVSTMFIVGAAVGAAVGATVGAAGVDDPGAAVGRPSGTRT